MFRDITLQCHLGRRKVKLLEKSYFSESRNFGTHNCLFIAVIVCLSRLRQKVFGTLHYSTREELLNGAIFALQKKQLSDTNCSTNLCQKIAALRSVSISDTASQKQFQSNYLLRQSIDGAAK